MDGGMDETNLFIEEDKYCEILRDWFQFFDQMKESSSRNKKNFLASVINAGNEISLSLLEKRLYLEAEMGFQLVYKQRSKILGPSHPATNAAQYSIGLACRKFMDTVNAIAQFYFEKRRYEFALKAFNIAYKKSAEVCGPSHTHTKAILYSIGRVLRAQGKLDEASEIFNECQHDLLERNNRAVDTLEKGMCEQALNLFSNIFESASKNLGSDHEDTLLYKHNICKALNELGRFEESVKRLEEISEASERKFGPDHEYTLNTLRDIGMSLFYLHKYEKSLAIFEKAYQRAMKVLEPDNPRILLVQSEIAIVLAAQKKFTEALHIYKHISEVQSKDKSSLEYLSTKIRIAAILRKQGYHDEVSAICAEVNEVLENTKPAEPEIWTEMAMLYASEKNYEAALKIYKIIYDMKACLYGPGDLRTIATKQDVGYMLAKLNKYDEALGILRDVSEKKEKVLGCENNDVKNTIMLMAELYAKQSKYKEAMLIYKTLYEMQNNLSFSPLIINLLTNTASMLCMMGRYLEALDKYKEIWNLRYEHPDYVYPSGTKNDIVAVLSKEGQNKEVLNNYKTLYKKSVESFGERDIISINILNTISEMCSSIKMDLT